MGKRTVYPVLDDTARDAMVMGWATSQAGALRVARREIRGWSDNVIVSADLFGSPVLRYDPDVHRNVAEVRRVNRGVFAWIVQYTPLK